MNYWNQIDNLDEDGVPLPKSEEDHIPRYDKYTAYWDYETPKGISGTTRDQLGAWSMPRIYADFIRQHETDFSLELISSGPVFVDHRGVHMINPQTYIYGLFLRFPKSETAVLCKLTLS